jgi:methionine biosynthesis protein MetW
MMRSDFAAIAEWVTPGSQVLDVGCGDGSLLHHLKVAKQAHVYGVELADDKVLALFEDQSFDKVILSQTLQTIHQTARILSEIARVGKECVVSFPNFGHWSHRSAVLLGRMPVSKSLPYQWYDTPNVRVLTIADFEALAPAVGLELLDRVVFHDGQSVEFLPNLRGSLAVYRARRAK